MACNGAKEVLKSLNEFIKIEQECKVITSDEESAFLSKIVLDIMNEHDIIYIKTTNNEHNKFYFINRFMRTIRVMMSEVDDNNILNLVESFLFLFHFIKHFLFYFLYTQSYLFFYYHSHSYSY